MEEAKIGLDDLARHVRSLTMEGAAGSVGGRVCHNLSLKILANSASVKLPQPQLRARTYTQTVRAL
jgi:hypothetical protein